MLNLAAALTISLLFKSGQPRNTKPLDFEPRTVLLSAPTSKECLSMRKLTNMKIYFCGGTNVWLMVGALLAALPLAASTARVYVANRGGTTIDIIDTTTNKVVDVIKGIESPEAV